MPTCHSGKVVKPAIARDARDPGLIPGSGRSPGVGKGSPLQYSCLEKPGGLPPMGSQKSQARLSTHLFLGRASYGVLQETDRGLLEAGFATTPPREIHYRCLYYQRRRAAPDVKSPSTPCLSLLSTSFPKVTWTRGIFKGMLLNVRASLVAQKVKRLPAMQETQV